MIAKRCRPALVVAVALVMGVAGTPSTASAHDCHGGWGAASAVLDDHHGDCPNPQPGVGGGGAYARYPAQAVAPAVTPLPAAMGDPALAPPAVPQAAPATPAPPGPPGPNAAGRTAAQHTAAGTGVTGGSWLPLALFSLAGLALLALIRAGFRARREIGAGLEARWPR